MACIGFFFLVLILLFSGSSLNRCSTCAYTWYPRGHRISLRCPKCRGTQVGLNSTPLIYQIAAVPLLLLEWTLLLFIWSTRHRILATISGAILVGISAAWLLSGDLNSDPQSFPVNGSIEQGKRGMLLICWIALIAGSVCLLGGTTSALAQFHASRSFQARTPKADTSICHCVRVPEKTGMSIKHVDSRDGGGAIVILEKSGTLTSPTITLARQCSAVSFTSALEMKFAWIPPGSFMMGSSLEEPGRGSDEFQHKVSLTRGYYISVHPITQIQWAIVMGNYPSHLQGDDLPVTNVIWNDCVQFCRKLQVACGHAFRLPTEAEWEYACRAGSKTAYCYGETISTTDASFGRQSMTNVAIFPANAWGLFDMHGNVWEWCSDWYSVYDNSIHIIDPKGPISGTARIVRGGCCTANAAICRSANRNFQAPEYRHQFLGFRVCFNLDARMDESEKQGITRLAATT